MSGSAVGRRYSRALLDLAAEQQQTDRVLRDLQGLRTAWDNSAELRRIVQDPSLPQELVRNTIVAVLDRLGTSPLVKNICCLLADRGRLRYLTDVIDDFESLAEAQSGRVRAEVTTATPMPDSYFSELQRKLEQITGSQVVLVKKEDPTLIGGVVTRVRDRIFDGSLRNQLDELKEHLLSQEL